MFRTRERLSIHTTEETLTKQSFKDSCDINNILARYQKTGVIDHYNKHGADYKECSPITFTEAQIAIANAKTMFNELPSKARKHFNNSPAEFLEFTDKLTDDDDNASILRSLGLLAKGSTMGLPKEEKATTGTTEPNKEAKPPEKAPEKTPEQPEK